MDANNLKLNEEQLKAVEYKTGPLLIIAGAGTGKTTVITERIKNLIEKGLASPNEILALTFTEKAAREMQERVDEALPYGYSQMWISTFHSFCDKVLRGEALHIGLDPRYKLMSESEAIQLIRHHLFDFDLDYFRPLGNPNKFIAGMLQHFSRLQDEDVAPSEYLVWAKSQKLKIKSEEGELEIKKYKELAGAYKKYDEIKIRKGFFDYGDLIVKTLQVFRTRKNILMQYQKQFKYILVDEYQDTNFAQNELVKLLAGKNGNITVVGDDDQCLPPKAKISTPSGDVAIKNIKVGDKVITAVGKGHTSSSKVVKIFKQKKKRSLLIFETKEIGKLTVTDNHKMFCFLPAHYDLKGWHFVYIMYHPVFGWRIGITKSLPQRLRLERGADKIIGIGSYKTDEEARFFEAYYSAKYGIPTVPFTPRLKQAISGQLLDRLFKDIDTRENIKNLAVDLKIDLDSPQFLVEAVTRGTSKRIKINFEMCARNYRSKWSKDGFVGNPTVLHQVSLETSNREVIGELLKAKVDLLFTKKGRKVRKNFADIKRAWEYAEKLQKITGGIIDKRFKVGRYNYQHLSSRIVPASHVFPGMYLPVLKGKRIYYKEVISRTKTEKIVETYDLEIEKTHNFIADGIVVHNSIYKFRGAAVSNIIGYRKSFPKTKIVTLTKNYRSTQEILDRAYDLIQYNNPDRLEVVEKINKKLVAATNFSHHNKIVFLHADRVENEAEEVAKEVTRLLGDKNLKLQYKDVAILVRANNHSEPFSRAFSRNGIPYQFLGPGRLFKQPEIIDLISYLKVLYNFEDSGAFYRILALDFFDIPARDLAAMGNFARRKNLSLFEAAEKVDDIFVSSSTKEKIKKILALINKHLGLVKKETAGQILYYFLQDSGLMKELISPDSSDAQKRALNISKFFDKLKTYEVDHEDATIPAVVDWLELSSELGESPLAANEDWTDINAVNILTVHSAKGLEFPVVFLVNLTSQRFPTTEKREQIPISEELIKEILPKGDFHLQEERRLFYVGMTRAKIRLYFTAADYYGEGKREKKLSPFIFEALGEGSVASEADHKHQLSFMGFKPQIKSTEVSNKKLQFHIDYLSYSQIETYKTCPLHYKLKYILNIPTAPSASQSFGTSIHAALRDFYNLVGSQKPTQKLLLELLNKNWITEGYHSKSHEVKFLEKGKKYLEEYFKSEFDLKVKTVATEKSFVIPLKALEGRPLKIGGRIDRVDIFPGGMIEIVDYKTGANVPTQKEIDRDLQMSFYALAATTLKEPPFAKNPDQVKMTFYYFDNQKKISTVRTKEQLEETVKEIFKVRSEMEKSDFVCSGSFLCKNCEYKLLCQAKD